MSSVKLYFDNPFRILGIPVDANQQDIKRQITSFDINIKVGKKLPKAIFSFNTELDAEQIQRSDQSLQNPEKRLFDEIFWFWPLQPGHGKDDEALLAMNKNDINSAIDIWLEEEKNDVISAHNLAIYYHLQALQFEYRLTLKKEKISGSDQRKCSDFWNQACSRWTLIMNSPIFWDRLLHRVEVLDYPMLTAGTVNDIKKKLPKTLCSINLKLAIDAIISSQDKELEKHCNIIKEASFDAEIIGQTLQEHSDQFFNHIDQIIKTAKQSVNENYLLGYDLAKQLIEDSKFQLYLYDNLLNDAHLLKIKAHDKIAEGILEIIIEFVNKSQKWTEFCDITDKLLKMAMGRMTIDRIKENHSVGVESLKQIQVNDEEMLWNTTLFYNDMLAFQDYLAAYPNGKYAYIARNRIDELRRCYFCNANGSQESSSVIVRMRKKLEESLVIVPRCNSCMKTHKKRFSQNLLNLVLSVLTGIIAFRILYQFNYSMDLMIIGFWASFALAFSFKRLMALALPIIATYLLYLNFVGELKLVEHRIIFFWACFAILWGISLSLLKYLIPLHVKRKAEYYKYNKVQQFIKNGWYVMNIK
jgi:hypothetical protein